MSFSQAIAYGEVIIWTCAAPTGLPAAVRFLTTFYLINLFLRILGQNLKKRGTNRSAAAQTGLRRVLVKIASI